MSTQNYFCYRIHNTGDSMRMKNSFDQMCVSLHRVTDGNEYLFQAKDDVSISGGVGE